MEQAQGTDAGGAAGAPRRAGRATRLLERVLADPRPPQRPLPGPRTRARLAAAGGMGAAMWIAGRKPYGMLWRAFGFSPDRQIRSTLRELIARIAAGGGGTIDPFALPEDGPEELDEPDVEDAGAEADARS